MRTPRLFARVATVPPVRTVWSVGRQALRDFVDHRSMRFGASLAFYTALSMAPLLVIFLAVAGAMWETAAAKRAFIEQLTRVIGPDAADSVRTVLTHASQIERSGWAALAGLVVLLFGATIVFVHLQEALNVVWGVDVKRRGVMKFIRRRILSLFMVLGAGGLLTLSLGASSVLSFLGARLEGGLPGGGFLWEALDAVASLGMFALVFALIFRILPDADVSWRDVWVGASVTAVLFALGKELIALYLGRVLVGSAFGAASSLMVLLIWVYYSFIILFFGAEVTQVYARHSGRTIEPRARGARPGLDILRRTSARVVRRGFRLRRRRAPGEGEEVPVAPPPLPAACAEAWQRVCNHRFVAAMTDGTLDPEVFRDFLLQDRLLLFGLSDAAGECVARRAGDPKAERTIVAALRRGLVAESAVQVRCLDLLGSSALESDATEPIPATARHLEHIRDWCSGPPARAAAALSARAGAYHALALELEPPSSPNEADPFELWQKTYAADAFHPGQSLVAELVRDTLECTMALWDEVLDAALPED